MTLAQFIAVVRRRRWWIVLLTVLGVGAGGAASVLATPQYLAESSVFVSVGGATVTDLTQGGTFSESRVASYVELARAPRVLVPAARVAGVDTDLEHLRKAVTARAVTDTVILSISAVDSDPERAAVLADAVSDRLVAAVRGLERTGQDGKPLVELSVFQRADAPDGPVSPRPAVNVVLGLIGGLGCGIVVALLLQTTDTKVRSVEALRQVVDHAVLAEVPLGPGGTESPLIEADDRYSERAEQFRQLRTQLTFTNVDGGSQSILVTSSVPGEGKSSTAVALALVLAEVGHRVVLVDADLRRPTVADVLGLEGAVGLSTLLTHQIELADALQPLGSTGLHVLASGRVPPNPSELLASRAMEVLVADLRAQYDYVVIDAPPVLPVTDPVVLAGRVSSVLLVGSVDGRLTTHDLRTASGRLQAVGARVVGVVANRVRPTRKATQYYGHEPSPAVRPRRRRGRQGQQGVAG